MLNKIWIAAILTAFLYALFGYFFQNQLGVFDDMMNAIFNMSKLTVEISIGLIGILAFWLGISKIAEQSGIIHKFAILLAPVFKRLMPEVPKGHESLGHVSMNLAANVMGLDNAATPLGLKAMKSLQTLNPVPDRATNAQILFLVLNTSSVTLFPVTVFMYRAQSGAASPTDVFLPILFATFASTLVGLLCVAWRQKLNLFDVKSIGCFAALFVLIAVFVHYLLSLSIDALAQFSAFWANISILFFICLAVTWAYLKKVDVYQSFVDGAKEGFGTAVNIIPYLLAMLIAIGLIRSCGLLDGILNGLKFVLTLFSMDIKFVDALPTGLLKPLSGSGARAMMIETMQTHGADSFAGRLSSIMQGSTETTFYVLAVYFGAVGIKYTRHAVSCGLIADAAGLTAAIVVCYLFFG
ncbi:nucleoside recognition domain-containing protein [Catenovulum maritimum]|uniref:Membrane protein n=1 Tax=Catenovulum maritimum TaxID=1513271 RepID=A0A0J8GMP3_9ALTE|nr:spore maturation protein [Catenovulum maritimum]KMT64047.1 membrane protein [Catenovulum maritimum]